MRLQRGQFRMWLPFTADRKVSAVVSDRIA
jgi:hypothetical protein